MKRRLVGIVAGTALVLGMAGALGCSPGGEAGQAGSDPISLYTRESGSGTRAMFVELFGIEETGEDGETVDLIDPSAAITNTTSVMMTTVADDENGIGYISLGTLQDDLVKAVSIDGVAPTLENVENGSYTVARALSVANDSETTDLEGDFLSFVLSAEGQEIVSDNDYLAVDEDAPSYEASGMEGKLVVAGSSSVYPVMEKLAEAYEGLNPGAEVDVQQNDSSTGAAMVAAGTCDLGMMSRELDDSELEEGIEATDIAWDGIVVIVNNASPVDDLSVGQVRGIFSGEITDWQEVAGA